MITRGDYFFMCYVEGANSPTVKHEDLQTALHEAKKLADKTEKEVFILKAVKSVSSVKYVVDDLKNQPLPF